MEDMATTLRLNDEEQAILNAMATAEQISAHEVIRLAIRERAARHGHAVRVDAAFTQARTDYADLLERLRQA